MKARILLILLLSINLSFVFAQHSVINVTVKGQVTDSLTKETIPYATLKIMSEGNPSTLVKALATDDDGKFQFTMNKKGKYLLLSEYIGKRTATQTIEIGDARTLDLGIIEMSDNAQALSEIEVTAQKPLVKVDLDKITYSMEDDPEAKTNNVLDMLKKVPLITVDGDENIQLKGSSSFKIYLNGKPSNMISNNPKDVLRSMPANTIKDIQVITDPGAKYDAEGVAGIINIITQKDSSMGGYTATVNGRIDNMGALGGGVYLSLKQGKIGFTGGYNYYEWKQPKGEYSSYRENISDMPVASETKYLYQNGFNKNNGNGQYGSGELSYEIDTLNLINVGFNRYYGTGKSKIERFNEMLDADRNSRYSYDQLGNTKSTYGGTDLNADYQRTFSVKDRLLTASYRLSLNPNDSKSNTDVLNATGTLPEDAVTNTQYTNADMKEHTFQADYVTPLGKIEVSDKKFFTHTLEAGAKYIIRINQSHSGKDVLGADGNWTPDESDNDRFKHRQDILAAYGGYSVKLDKWGMKTGLRYEATWLDAKFPINEEQNFKVDYSNVVPSITFTYQPQMQHSIRLGYNMRISRPGIWQLNPYNNTSDANYQRVGNPELDAVKTHSISSNYGYFSPKLNLNFNLSYDFENNGIEDITSITDEGISLTTYDNIGKRRNAGLSVYLNWTPGGNSGFAELMKKIKFDVTKIRLYTNMSGRYTNIKTNNDRNLSNDGFNGNIFAGLQYSMPKDFQFNLNSGFFSPRISLQGKSPSFYFYGLSLSKEFKIKHEHLKGVTVRAYVDNPLTKDREFRNKNTTDIFYSETVFNNRMRRFGISFSLRLGEMKAQIKKAQRGINNDDNMGGGQGSGQTGQGGGQGG